MGIPKTPKIPEIPNIHPNIHPNISNSNLEILGLMI
tara:strand:- start:665 stop:772 length:108 start_codon:yes stop_codon:yes gene_type:complete